MTRVGTSSGKSSLLERPPSRAVLQPAGERFCCLAKGDAEVATYVADAAQEQLAEAAIAKVVSQFSDDRGSWLCLTALPTVCPTYQRIAHLRHSCDRLVSQIGHVSNFFKQPSAEARRNIEAFKALRDEAA